MRILLICFLGMTPWVVLAQQEKDSVRLVDIRSSECGGMYHVEPHFTSKLLIGDTTYITLSCTNNCAGYHNPKVFIAGDSVKIDIGYGARTNEDKMFYRINGKLLDIVELNELESKNYPEKYDRSDSTLITVVTESIAYCDCCYTFDLKIVGLDSSRSYNYFYNEEFINPDYTEFAPGIPFKFGYFFEQTPSKVSKRIGKIILRENNFKSNPFTIVIDLTIDTINCSITDIRTNLNQSNSKHSPDQKLKQYLHSLSLIECTRNPNTSRLIDRYSIIVEYDQKTKRTVISCVPREILNP